MDFRFISFTRVERFQSVGCKQTNTLSEKKKVTVSLYLARAIVRGNTNSINGTLFVLRFDTTA